MRVLVALIKQVLVHNFGYTRAIYSTLVFSPPEFYSSEMPDISVLNERDLRGNPHSSVEIKSNGLHCIHF